jgi:hypothetical protein
MKVYYFLQSPDNSHRSNQHLDQCDYEPAPVLQSIKHLREYQCPSVREYYHNVFVVPSFWDFDFEVNQQGIRPRGLPYFVPHRQLGQLAADPQLYQYANMNLDPWVFCEENDYAIQIVPGLTVFPEHSCDVEFLPATCAHNDFTTKCSLITGRWDAGMWLRPMSVAFRFRKGFDHLQIGRGDHVSYVKICTPEPVEWVRVQRTPEISQVIGQNLSFKRIKPRCPMHKLYEHFDQTRQRVLDICEANRWPEKQQ